MRGLQVLGSAALATIALATPALGQPSRSPDDLVVPPAMSQERAAQSDENRVVGTVLQIDGARGRVKLATEEGEMTLPAPPHMLPVIRVGDTISVPRPVDPSASPRQ
jgi:hypothetical protein